MARRAGWGGDVCVSVVLNPTATLLGQPPLGSPPRVTLDGPISLLAPTRRSECVLRGWVSGCRRPSAWAPDGSPPDARRSLDREVACRCRSAPTMTCRHGIADIRRPKDRQADGRFWVGAGS